MGFGTITFTSRGRALQAKATADTELHFNRISVGDGQLSGQAVDELTSLIHEVKSIAINELRVLSGNKAKIGGVLSNQGLATGFYWRELGVYAQDPDLGEILYCYGNAGALAEYIPAQGGSEILEKQVNVIAIVGSAANITATIDQSLVYATKQELNDKISHSLATAAGDFLVASKAGQFVKKTLAEIKALLGLGTAAYKNFDSAGGVAAYDTVQTHLSDYVRQPGYGVTSGSANTYTLTLSPAPAAYVDGMGIVVKINAANTGASTINVNGLGAKAIVDGKGNALAAAKLRLNGTYSLKYNSTSGNFILQGEGGEISKPPNLIKNGNYVNGSNCWSAHGATITSVENNVLTYLPSQQYGGVIQEVPKPSANDKIYMRCAMKGQTSSRFIFYIKSGVGVVLTPTVIDVWQTLSTVTTYPADGTQAYIDFDNDVGSGWTQTQVRNVMYCNLTKWFGAGNEPSKDEMDAAVDKFGGWWDSDLPLLTTDANTAVGHVLANKVFYTANGIKAYGSMPDRTGANTEATMLSPYPGILHMKPRTGYYDELGPTSWVYKYDANYIPENIVSGKSIFGLVGSFQGKNWTSGTVTSSTNMPLFYSFFTQGAYLPTVTVSGLSFLPKLIYVRYNSGGASPIQYVTIYDSYANTARANSAMIQAFNGGIGVNDSTVRTIDITTGGGYVNSEGFCLPVISSNTPYYWIAFE